MNFISFFVHTLIDSGQSYYSPWHRKLSLSLPPGCLRSALALAVHESLKLPRHVRSDPTICCHIIARTREVVDCVTYVHNMTVVHFSRRSQFNQEFGGSYSGTWNLVNPWTNWKIMKWATVSTSNKLGFELCENNWSTQVNENHMLFVTNFCCISTTTLVHFKRFVRN